MKKPCPDCAKLEERVKALEDAVEVLSRPRGSDLIGPGPRDYAVDVAEFPPLTEDEIKEIQRALDGYNLPTDVLHPFLHPFRGMK